MSTLKPYRSFTSSSIASEFPALKVLFHADDYMAGATTWAARYGSITANLAAAATKDVNGVYTTVSNSVSSITGTMPTVSGKYVVVAAIGTLKSDSGTIGVGGAFGDTLTTGPGLGATAVAMNSSGTSIIATQPSLTGTITAGSKACQASYFDMADTSSPAIYRVLASGLSTDQAIPNVSTTADVGYGTGQIIMGAALASSMVFTPLAANNDGRRAKVFALFEFTTSMTIGELQLACAEMARTQELFAGWRNRV